MARGGGFPGGMNMQGMLKQVQQMQQRVESVQAGFEDKELETAAGGGMVKVTVSGTGKIKELTIAPEVVDPDDIEMLEDLVIAAVNEAISMATEYRDSELAKATGGAAGALGGLF